MIRHGGVLALFLCFGAISSATAQTLTSITINGAPPSPFKTGAFVELTATGTFTLPAGGTATAPVYVNWTSSDSTVVSVDNTTGVATALKGSATPITITATSTVAGVSPATLTIPSVLQQEALYTTDGNTLSIFDASRNLPTISDLITTVPYHSTVVGGNGNWPVPMALSSDERYLFIANPAYLSNTAQDFSVVAIDTQSFKKVATITTGLCYPSSLAVASHYLFVVNAGNSTGVQANSPATDGGCSSATSANVQVFDISQVTSANWSSSFQFNPTDLETCPGSPTAPTPCTTLTGSTPLVVAASSDQSDQKVYVGSAKAYSRTPSSAGSVGLISAIDLSSGTPTVVDAVALSLTTNLAILPVGLTVATAYPTWAGQGQAVHTVVFVGPGATTGGPTGGFGGSNIEMLGFFSDACESATQIAGCSLHAPESYGISLNGVGGLGSYPGSYNPVAMSQSPSGQSVYAALGVYLVEFSSPDGTSSGTYSQSSYTGFANVASWNSSTGNSYNQCLTGCQPISAATSTSDSGTLFIGSNQLDVVWMDPISLGPQLGTEAVGALTTPAGGMIVSQSPVVLLSLKQSGTTILSASFAIRGNFQNPDSIYNPSCVWGAGQPTWDPGKQPSEPTGQTWFPNLPDYSQVTPQDVQIIPAIDRDANDPPGSIITGVSVGPVTTTLDKSSLTVALGSTNNNVSAQVTNANNDSAVTWHLNNDQFPTCTSPAAQGPSCPLGVIIDNLNNSVTYDAPPTAPSSSLGQPVITAKAVADSTAQASVTVTLLAPPTVTTASLPGGTVGAAYSQTLQASGGTTPYAWSVTSGALPAGLSLSTAGVISGTPTTAGPSSFTVTVTDANSLTATMALNITVVAQLAVTTASLPGGTIAAAYNQTLQASGGTTPYSWSVTSGALPTGLSLSAVGVISGTPTTVGTSNFTVTVTDANSVTANKALSIVIAQVTVTTASLPGGAVGTAYSQTLQAAGGTTPYSWLVTSGTLPAGLSLSVAGVISGTPTTVGTSNFTVTVTDANAVTASKPLSIVVAQLTITTASLPGGAVGTAYSQSLQAAGGATPYTWSITSGALPPGLSLSAAGVISGTPTTVGTSSFTVTVTDANSLTANKAFSIVVAQVTVTTASLPGGTVGTVYNQTLQAAGGTAPYTWSVTSGTLPAGLSLSAAGVISGTPTTAGTSNFTVTVTDANSLTANKALSVVVASTATPTATLSTASFTFATVQSVGTTSGPSSPPITLTNTGQANLVLASVPLSLGGANPGDFAVGSGTTCTAALSLAPNGTCNITLTFSPSAAGTRTATLVITDNSGGTAGSTQSVALSGSAISITVFPANAQLEAGTTQTFVPNILPSSASGPVTWSVSGNGCGGHACGTIDANGVYSVPANLAGPATDTIKAVLNSNTAVFGTTQASLFLKPVLSSGQSVTVQAGQAATYNLSIAGGTGDALSPLKLQCLTETLPNGVSCQTVTVQPGAATVGFTFTMQTTGRQTASIRSTEVLLGGFAFVVPFCCLIRLRKQIKHSSLILSVLAVVALSCMGLVGCGTNGSFGSTTPKTFGGTPVGSYTIQLQGTGPSGTPENIGTVGLVVQ